MRERISLTCSTASWSAGIEISIHVSPAEMPGSSFS
jgi:hypothetical protein